MFLGIHLIVNLLRRTVPPRANLGDFLPTTGDCCFSKELSFVFSPPSFCGVSLTLLFAALSQALGVTLSEMGHLRPL